MSVVTVTIHDEVRCTFTGIAKQHMAVLYDQYHIFASGYKYKTAYILGAWDGKVEYFKKHGGTFVYLLPEIIKKLTRWGYTVDLQDNRISPFYEVTEKVDKTYFSHKIFKKTGLPYELQPHQVTTANLLLAEGGGIALAGTGFGKAQPLHCKVLTPTGWRQMGDLEVGDEVVTPKNTVVQINGVFDQGVTDVYKVTMSDGGFTYAHPEHLWKVYDSNWLRHGKSAFSIQNTMDLVNRVNNTKQKTFIPVIPVALDFEQKSYQVDPFILGSLLPSIRSTKFDLFVHVRNKTGNGFSVSTMVPWLEVLGFRVIVYGLKIVIKPTNDESQKLYDYLCYISRELKGIPHDYIFTTGEDRLKFLQGVCSTTCALSYIQGVVSFSVLNTDIIPDLKDMIHMQGGRIIQGNTSNLDDDTDSPEVIESKTKYIKTINFYHKYPDNFFVDHDAKKVFLCYQEEKKRVHMRRVYSVELCTPEPTRCISIDDPDHLYITDDCIITHNTILNAALCDIYAKKGCKTLTIVPATTLIVQTVKQFKELGLDVHHYNSAAPSIEHDHIVTTWQTLQNSPHLIKLFQMVVVDECLAGDTKVLLANGEYEEIKNIKIGQKIISYNVETKLFEEDTVLKLHQNLLKSSNEKMYRLDFDDGTSIEVTGNHLVLTDEGYVRTDALNEGHNIISC